MKATFNDFMHGFHVFNCNLGNWQTLMNNHNQYMSMVKNYFFLNMSEYFLISELED